MPCPCPLKCDPIHLGGSLISEKAQSKQLSLGLLGTCHCRKSWSWLAKGVSRLEYLAAGATNPLSPPLPPPHHGGEQPRAESAPGSQSRALPRRPCGLPSLRCPEMPGAHWDARAPAAGVPVLWPESCPGSRPMDLLSQEGTSECSLWGVPAIVHLSAHI